MIKVFVVEDEIATATLIKRTLEQIDNFEVIHFNHAQECLNNLHQNPDVVSIDYNLPDMNGVELMQKIKAYNESINVIIVSGQEEVAVVVKAYKSGALDYIIKNESFVIELVNSVKNASSTLLLKKEVEKLKEQIIDRNKYSNIIGSSKALLQVLKLIQKSENSNMTVLITGESGTGKELVSKALHYNSLRKKKPFVIVNMTAIPDELIESELFGHEKGAFTDASERRIGKFEEANEGTIFLDEIGDMKFDLQTKLLRILEERVVTRVGGNKIIKLDVRVIAATNKNLTVEVNEGRFRKDLYYRLQGFLIQLPTLKERDDDIILLAKHFLKEFCETNRIENKTISKEVIKILMNYSWHGNVRELKAVIERSVLLAEGNTITPEDIIFPN